MRANNLSKGLRFLPIAFAILWAAALPALAEEFVPVHRVEPVRPARATIVMVHGTTQHAGSFGVLANHLTDRGFRVVAMDLRGHGERFHNNDGDASEKRVDYAKSAEDLASVFRQLRKDDPEGRIFCIGESVGATVATHAAGQAPKTIDGLILCSAGIRPRVYNFNPLMVAGDFLSHIWRLDHKLDVTRYILRYSSDDSHVSQEMVADPLSRVSMTGREILQTGWFLRSCPEAAKHVDARLPVLIVQGELDGIVSGRTVKAILKNFPSNDKQIVTFKGAGHVLFGTSFLKPAVVRTLTAWLEERSAAGNHATAHVPSLTTKAN